MAKSGRFVWSAILSPRLLAQHNIGLGHGTYPQLMSCQLQLVYGGEKLSLCLCLSQNHQNPDHRRLVARQDI